jgi:hypothetical protein
MKRVVSLAVVVTLLAASPAFAAGPDSTSPRPSSAAAPATVKYDFSAKAAGIDRLPQPTARQDAAAPAPAQPDDQKSIWKKPWPYLIIAGGVAALVVISRSSEGGGFLY